MSRSYKKYPVIYYEGKEDTKYMNRQLRRTKGEVPKGNKYKKLQRHWLWHPCRWTKEDAINDYESGEYSYLKMKFPTLKSYLNYWAKCVRRK